MNNPNTTIFLDHQRGREHYYTLVATPEALHRLAKSIFASLVALPAPSPTAQKLPLDGFTVADADGSCLEVYLSIRAEPSLAWLEIRRRRTVKREWAVMLLMLAVIAFAIFGFGTFVRWLLTYAA